MGEPEVDQPALVMGGGDIAWGSECRNTTVNDWKGAINGEGIARGHNLRSGAMDRSSTNGMESTRHGIHLRTSLHKCIIIPIYVN